MASNVIGYALILIWVTFLFYFGAQYFMKKSDQQTSTTTPPPSTTTPPPPTNNNPSSPVTTGSKTNGGNVYIYCISFNSDGSHNNEIFNFKVASIYSTLQEVIKDLTSWLNSANLMSAFDIEYDSGNIIVEFPNVRSSTKNTITYIWTTDSAFSQSSGLNYDAATQASSVRNGCTYDTDAARGGNWKYIFKGSYTLPNSD